ncbi:hypothetical protein LTR53_018308, partial [Teratosphaeriaceae sp. CCFEE 6253]
MNFTLEDDPERYQQAWIAALATGRVRHFRWSGSGQWRNDEGSNGDGSAAELSDNVAGPPAKVAVAMDDKASVPLPAIEAQAGAAEESDHIPSKLAAEPESPA